MVRDVIGVNSSFIALIPKVEQPQLVKDFRPISLINCTIKIVTKVLANRLKRVLSSLITENQSAIITGRQIPDGILVANELVHGLSIGPMKGLILKLDFEKAFDSISWEFLFQFLRKMKFGERWIQWVKNIFSTIRILIMINGSPSVEFSPQRGIRQGDPLSPLLFFLVGQIFHCMLEEAKQQGIFSGIAMNEGRVSFHIFNSQMTLFFS